LLLIVANVFGLADVAESGSYRIENLLSVTAD